MNFTFKGSAQIRITAPTILKLSLMGLDSFRVEVARFECIAEVVERCDGVFDLVVAHQMDVSVFVMDEGEEKALHLHEGLTQGVELELARRVDCSHHLGLHIQDNPVCSISLATTQDAELINANLAED